MEFLHQIKLIQGGMGVYVSNWRLAKAVAKEKPGITAGTVSGTGLDVVYVRLLQLGDPGGHVQRALLAFDSKFDVSIGKKICDKYFIENGKTATARFKNSAIQAVHPLSGKDVLPPKNELEDPVIVKMDVETIELVIATAFAEVWLAKEGHEGKVFINLMKKVELPLIYAMYGAILAGVDAIVVGAGNPDGLSEVCTKLAKQECINLDIPVLYREAGETFLLSFDPKEIGEGNLASRTMDRPAFLAIVSQENLVKALANSNSEPPDGFIIEHHTAGGHNAGPQGPMRTDSLGQPVYGELDEPDLNEVRAVNIPFWLAGGYGSRDKLANALAVGACGVQAGSVFALSIESGMKSTFKTAILNKIKQGEMDSEIVQTTLYSPTGFPFKVVQVEGTLSDVDVYTNRTRVCDIGLLQQRGVTKPDEQGMRRLFQRCPAAPIEDFIRKRGLPHNTQEKRCLCNGLLATVGLGQGGEKNGVYTEEPAIVTLGNHLRRHPSPIQARTNILLG